MCTSHSLQSSLKQVQIYIDHVKPVTDQTVQIGTNRYN